MAGPQPYVMDLLAALEQQLSVDGSAAHDLPPEMMARMEGNDAWRDPGFGRQPGDAGRDWVNGNLEHRDDMAKYMVGKMILNHLTDAVPGRTGEVLRDSLLATQAENLRNKTSGSKSPTMLMFSTKW